MLNYDPLHTNDIFAKSSVGGAVASRLGSTASVPRTALMSIDQQLQLMNTINTLVKNGQFSTQLANTIFALCTQLKASGQMLEQSHKNELNKVFVSLRQACCRDNGQLGTPCRLKIMELVELRAMHWRSNLAHSQYYTNRPDQQPDPPLTSASPASSGASATPPPPSMQFMQQSSLFMPPDMGNSAAAAAAAAAAANPGFYLIPAAGGWMPPILPGMAPNPFMPPPMLPPEHVLMRQRSLKKPNPLQKTMQLRHEMIIRNSDSGKIMGVKGRRVALVEQITNTVISFQKVDPKSKERTLTITASTMEDIERAKDLIIDTIRRNTSPVRQDNPSLMPVTDASGLLDDDDEDEDENDISIETTQDGMLKLCCSDPQVLQAAQAALSEYLRVRARPSAEEREKKKERRKSMPLQNSQPDAPVATLKSSRSFHGSTPNLADPLPLAPPRPLFDLTGAVGSAGSAGSGGSAGSVIASTAANVNGSVSRYDRAAIVALRGGAVPVAEAASANGSDTVATSATETAIRDKVAAVAPEILRPLVQG